MAFVWLLCIFILHVLFCSCTADKHKCDKTLNLCKLKVDDHGAVDFLKQQPKGEKGDKGPRGEKGERGLIEPGQQGKPGEQGVRGLQGNAPSGDIGDEGGIGIKGITGDKGFMGEKGIFGLKGLRGDKGIPGAIGPPGRPGDDGSCPCEIKANNKTDRSKKITLLCKDSPAASNKTYILKLNHYQLQVQCIIRERATAITCIQPKTKSEPEIYSVQNTSTGFWLSSKGLTLDKVYGLNRQIISIIHEQSNSAFQTIRYHCKNAIPFSRENVEKSLLLLTWNDNTIGPMPTSTKPFFYSINHDGCSNTTKDTWSFTDIKLVSVAPRRVPVIDFFIRDIRKDITQEIKIENIELCFD